MNNIKISVIVPVYNVEKYLDKCLNSIITQSLKEIEIIIVNDCSPDNSLEIIKKYMKFDKRIVLINKIKNEGLTSARNSGLETAQGEYILHIDSDDWIEQDYLKDMYETAIKYNADMVISNFYYDYEEKKITYRTDMNYKTGNILKNKEYIENGCFAVWNKLIKKEVYTKNRIKFPEGISIGEDLLTTTILKYYSKKIIKLSKAYYHYIQNQNSMTKKPKYSALTDIYYILNKLEDFFKDKSYDSFLKKIVYNHLAFWIYKTEPNFDDKLYNEILDKYLTLLETKKNKPYERKYIKYYFILRKFFNKKQSFKIIWKLLFLQEKIKLFMEK